MTLSFLVAIVITCEKREKNGSQSVKIVLSFNQSIKRRKTVYIFLLRAF